jgi:uncharacterized protein YaaQ
MSGMPTGKDEGMNAVNRLVVATVAGSQADELIKRLTDDGFYATVIDSQGGILYEATEALLIGLDKKHLPRLLKHVRECCRTRLQYIPAHVEAPLLEAQASIVEAQVGGASVYVFSVERFEQF